MSDVVIEAKELTKRYGDVTALLRASFEVRKGEVLGFLGPNGAGKTTCMKILTGFIAPTDGTAKVNGFDVFEDPLSVRRSLGYLPESNPLYVEMLTLEFLEWVARMRGLKGEDARRRIRKIVDETAIGDVIAKEIRALSKGFRQRVGLAAALMHEPPILILDEPMSGLDPNQAVEIRELMREIGRERTVILSTHNLFEVQLTCDRVLIVSNGKIVADDRPDDLRARAGKPRYFVALSEESKGARRDEAAAKAHKVLQGVKGVERVTQVAGSPARELHFELLAATNDDLRATVFAALAGAELTLLELGRKQVDLEAVFRDLTIAGDDKKKADARAKKKDADQRRKKRERAEAKKKADDDVAPKKKAEKPDDDEKAGKKAASADGPADEDAEGDEPVGRGEDESDNEDDDADRDAEGDDEGDDDKERA